MSRRRRHWHPGGAGVGKAQRRPDACCAGESVAAPECKNASRWDAGHGHSRCRHECTGRLPPESWKSSHSAGGHASVSDRRTCGARLTGSLKQDRHCRTIISGQSTCHRWPVDLRRTLLRYLSWYGWRWRHVGRARAREHREELPTSIARHPVPASHHPNANRRHAGRLVKSGRASGTGRLCQCNIVSQAVAQACATVALHVSFASY